MVWTSLDCQNHSMGGWLTEPELVYCEDGQCTRNAYRNAHGHCMVYTTPGVDRGRG